MKIENKNISILKINEQLRNGLEDFEFYIRKNNQKLLNSFSIKQKNIIINNNKENLNNNPINFLILSKLIKELVNGSVKHNKLFNKNKIIYNNIINNKVFNEINENMLFKFFKNKFKQRYYKFTFLNRFLHYVKVNKIIRLSLNRQLTEVNRYLRHKNIISICFDKLRNHVKLTDFNQIKELKGSLRRMNFPTLFRRCKSQNLHFGRSKKNVFFTKLDNILIKVKKNNVFLILRNFNGKTKIFFTSGMAGFKNSKKKSIYAVKRTSKFFFNRVVKVNKKFVGIHFESSLFSKKLKAILKIFSSSFLRVSLLRDLSPYTHNGLKHKKIRRV